MLKAERASNADNNIMTTISSGDVDWFKESRKIQL